MNIGVDIDGTLTKYPAFFNELFMAWGTIGNVYVITGLGHKLAVERMKKLESEWPEIWGSYELIDTSMYNNEEILLAERVDNNEEVVGIFKQRMCKELNVSIMFDDMASVHRQFGDTPIFEVK